MSKPRRWLSRRFHELSTGQLFDLLTLRQQVFIVEQQCIYPDADELDRTAIHVLGYSQTALLAYARVLAPGAKFASPSFGRVATAREVRGQGLGRDLVRRCLQVCQEQYPGQDVQISAQTYLDTFYREFGFVAQGRRYDEDGIEHRNMVRTCPTLA